MCWNVGASTAWRLLLYYFPMNDNLVNITSFHLCLKQRVAKSTICRVGATVFEGGALHIKIKHKFGKWRVCHLNKV